MRTIHLVFVILCSLALSSCADKTPLSSENKMYAGKWTANDGTWIQVYNDGGGSFELSNSSVNGGATAITDSTLEIGLFGIEATFKIDKQPYQEEGVWKMQLDGNVYLKQ